MRGDFAGILGHPDASIAKVKHTSFPQANRLRIHCSGVVGMTKVDTSFLYAFLGGGAWWGKKRTFGNFCCKRQ